MCAFLAYFIQGVNKEGPMYFISNGGQTTWSYGLTIHVANSQLTAMVKTRGGTLVAAIAETFTLSDLQVLCHGCM